MITKEKLKIYQSYDGDISSWARADIPEEKAVMTDEDWYLIENLIQDILLVKKGLASASFGMSVQKETTSVCDNDETVVLLNAIVQREIAP